MCKAARNPEISPSGGMRWGTQQFLSPVPAPPAPRALPEASRRKQEAIWRGVQSVTTSAFGGKADKVQAGRFVCL